MNRANQPAIYSRARAGSAAGSGASASASLATASPTPSTRSDPSAAQPSTSSEPNSVCGFSSYADSGAARIAWSSLSVDPWLAPFLHTF